MLKQVQVTGKAVDSSLDFVSKDLTLYVKSHHAALKIPKPLINQTVKPKY